jgi:8-oxo-dGTP diphosphatase
VSGAVANPFESGARKVVPAVLVYLRCGNEVLMLQRAAREGDIHAGKWNGLGGKLEADEAPRTACAREVFEEAGILLPPERYRHLGLLQFPNFKAHKQEDWLCWVFDAELKTGERGEIWKQGDEGTLHWIRTEQVASLNLWPGDRQFLPWVLSRTPFCGTFWYEAGEVVRSELYPWGN